jgi:hypothetical protein
MGRLVPRYYGKNDILTSFEEKAKTPYWSFWDSSSRFAQNNDIDDMDESIAMLESEIDRNIKNNYDRPVTLILHNKKEKDYTKKSEGTVLICMCLERHAYSETQQNNQIANYNLYNELNALKSELNALKNAQLVDESEDEDEYEDESFIGSVKTLLNEPVIAGLINKFLQPGTPVNNLAGIDNNNVNDILNVLFSKGVTVEHLNKLSQMPESQIKMLLNML